MARSEILLATRSPHKAREIAAILEGAASLRLRTLTELGVAPSEEEEEVESGATFLQNAVAKARYFADRTGLPTLADDSGLCVPALGGLPGVRSKRFASDAGRVAPDAPGGEVDRANNRLLVERLVGSERAGRAAFYVCAAALAHPDGRLLTSVGTWSGIIADEPRGDGGFGYDPIFELSESGCTAAELGPGEKERISHRARALRALSIVLE